MPAMQATLLGAGFGLGLVLLTIGLRRTPRRHTVVGQSRITQLTRGRGPIQAAAGLVAVAFVLLATGWLVGALLAALATWTLPGMLVGAERARQRWLHRLQGIAGWTESLVATLGGAAGLEQAITATATTAPASVRTPVAALAVTLQHGGRLPDALRAFADELADPVADTVAASLLLASTHGAGQLAEPLSLLAAAARDDVAAQHRVEKGRAKATTDARLIIMTTLAMAVGLVAFNRGYLRPYDSAAGQVVLALVGALFAVGFRWLHGLARQHELPRVLDLAASGSNRTTDDQPARRAT
jgi:tight adherence protein B